jgi:hypothetical protein
MAQNQKPLFAYTPQLAFVTISTANTARDGSGTLGTLYIAPTGGCKITKFWFKAQSTTTAGMIRFFVTDVNGANPTLFLEMNTTAITPSAAVSSNTSSYLDADFQLKAGQVIKVSTEKAEIFNVFAMVGDFANV